MKVLRNGKKIDAVTFRRQEMTEEEMMHDVVFYMSETWEDWDEDDREEIAHVLRAYSRGFFSFEDVHDILSDEYPWFRWPWDVAVLAN